MAKIECSCLICEAKFIRWQSQIDRGAGKTCSWACRAKYLSGDGNPFWRRTHSDYTKAKISSSKKGQGVGMSYAKGYKHTEEAKKRIAESSKRLWATKRQEMIDSLPRGEQHHAYKPPDQRKYRETFSALQKREWLEAKCAYCDTTEGLELDHIVPLFDGGVTVRVNIQTLCRGCNMWKTEHVDIPRSRAWSGCQGR